MKLHNLIFIFWIVLNSLWYSLLLLFIFFRVLYKNGENISGNKATVLSNWRGQELSSSVVHEAGYPSSSSMVLKAWVIHGESIKMFVLILMKEQHSIRLDELAGLGGVQTDKTQIFLFHISFFRLLSEGTTQIHSKSSCFT